MQRRSKDRLFDAILQQKEHVSAYVFEDLAADYLQSNAELRTAFETAKQNDPALAESGRAQLQWIYEHTPHYEYTHKLYPIGRMEK